MKTTPKIIAMLMALVLCGSLLAGCGGDGGAESSASGQNAGASAAEDGAYTITMAYIGSEQPNEESVLAAVQEQVKADTEFNLELIQLGFGDYQQKLNLMLSGGDKLDVFPIGPGLAGTYKNAGQLVELTELIDTHGQGSWSLWARTSPRAARSTALSCARTLWRSWGSTWNPSTRWTR